MLTYALKRGGGKKNSYAAIDCPLKHSVSLGFESIAVSSVSRRQLEMKMGKWVNTEKQFDY